MDGLPNIFFKKQYLPTTRESPCDLTWPTWDPQSHTKHGHHSTVETWAPCFRYICIGHFNGTPSVYGVLDITSRVHTEEIYVRR